MGRFEMSDHSDLIVRHDYTDLPFTSEQLLEMTKNHSAPVSEYVPHFRYWACDEGCRMDRTPNYCGHQQRAFEFYHCLLAFISGRVALSVGAGGIGSPNCLHTDKYNGVPPPNDGGRYGAGYSNSIMELDADCERWPFFDERFGAVIFNHSFEHLTNQEHALKEALRVLGVDGRLCIIMPDMTYSRRGSIDPTHTTEWSADGFLQYVKSLQGKEGFPNFVVESHNTLNNVFSFDTVLRRV